MLAPGPKRSFGQVKHCLVIDVEIARPSGQTLTEATGNLDSSARNVDSSEGRFRLQRTARILQVCILRADWEGLGRCHGKGIRPIIY